VIIKKNAGIVKRFGYALNGLTKAFQRERSLRTEVLAVAILIGFCLWSKPTSAWCALFAAISALVIGLEVVNSAFEAVLDKIHPEEHEAIGYAKDCLAGAVMIACMAAVFILLCYCIQRYS
jgi:diacylglycerol kinase